MAPNIKPNWNEVAKIRVSSPRLYLRTPEQHLDKAVWRKYPKWKKNWYFAPETRFLLSVLSCLRLYILTCEDHLATIHRSGIFYFIYCFIYFLSASEFPDHVEKILFRRSWAQGQGGAKRTTGSPWVHRKGRKKGPSWRTRTTGTQRETWERFSGEHLKLSWGYW